MMKNTEGISRMGCRLIALAGLVVALGLGMHPTQAWAVDCAAVLTAGDPGAAGPDFDNDGFTDYQECTVITTTGGTSPKSFPWCGSADGLLLSREECVDPNSKDLFVIYAPASGSLLPAGYKPFGTVTAYGIEFLGLSSLGVTVHQLSPDQIGLDRIVTTGFAQKAVRVAENLDANGTVLGYCQWGTPNGLDGCTMYTLRTRNFISSTCGTLSIVTATGVASTLNDVFNAYTTYLILHETGHSIGGLTAAYNSRFGGYHYQPGTGLLMEQAVTYSAKAGKCKFYIAPVWNAQDAAAVKLK